MQVLRQMKSWQAALAVAIAAVASFTIFSYGIGLLEQGLITSVLFLTKDLYRNYLTNSFRFSGSFSLFYLLGGIVGMFLSIALYREFSFKGLDLWRSFSGVFGGIVLGFGAAMIGGGSLTYFMGQVPLLSLAGFIGVLFMVIGLYIGNGFGGEGP